MGRPIGVCKLFPSLKSPLECLQCLTPFQWKQGLKGTVYDQVQTYVRTVSGILFCGASSWLIAQFIPLVMLAEQFLELSVCKPCGTHTTHVLQSIPCSSVSCVARYALEVLLNKNEAASEGGERGSLNSNWPPLLKDSSLSFPLQLLFLHNPICLHSLFTWCQLRYSSQQPWDAAAH